MALTASWQTTDSSPVRPTVDDEREHVGFYLVQVLYRVIPVLYESLQQALRDTYGEELPLPRLLRFGTWVGGDMDGNPNVDAHTIRNTLDAQRQAVLGRYQKELLQLASLLSQSTERVGVSEALQARVAHYQQLLPQVQSRRAMPTCRTACSTTACAPPAGHAGRWRRRLRRPRRTDRRPAADPRQPAREPRRTCRWLRRAAPAVAGEDLRLPPGAVGRAPGIERACARAGHRAGRRRSVGRSGCIGSRAAAGAACQR
jgi:hypothetical protein